MRARSRRVQWRDDRARRRRCKPCLPPRDCCVCRASQQRLSGTVVREGAREERGGVGELGRGRRAPRRVRGQARARIRAPLLRLVSPLRAARLAWFSCTGHGRTFGLNAVVFAPPLVRPRGSGLSLPCFPSPHSALSSSNPPGPAPVPASTMSSALKPTTINASFFPEHNERVDDASGATPKKGKLFRKKSGKPQQALRDLSDDDEQRPTPASTQPSTRRSSMTAVHDQVRPLGLLSLVARQLADASPFPRRLLRRRTLRRARRRPAPRARATSTATTRARSSSSSSRRATPRTRSTGASLASGSSCVASSLSRASGPRE